MQGEDRPGVPPCGLDACEVCAVRAALLDAGAEDIPSASLRDGDCDIAVVDQGDCTCQSRLRVDIDKAAYRRIAGSKNDTKMCDRVVIAVVGEEGRAIALELKRSHPEWPAGGEQLQQGIRMLHDHFGERLLPTVPRACFVLGKRADQFQRILQAEGFRVRYGSQPVPVEVLECGSTIDVSAAGLASAEANDQQS